MYKFAENIRMHADKEKKNLADNQIIFLVELEVNEC